MSEFNDLRTELFRKDNIELLKEIYNNKDNEKENRAWIFFMDSMLEDSSRHGSFKVLDFLLSKEDIRIPDHDYFNAVRQLINCKGGLTYIKKIIENENYPYHFKDNSNFIYRCAQYKRVTILKYFLSKPSLKIEKNLDSIIKEVCQKQSSGCLKLILENPMFKEDSKNIILACNVLARKGNEKFLDIFLQNFPKFKINKEEIRKVSEPFNHEKDTFEESINYLKMKGKLLTF